MGAAVPWKGGISDTLDRKVIFSNRLQFNFRSMYDKFNTFFTFFRSQILIKYQNRL